MVYGGISGNSEQLLYMLQPEGTVVNENGRYAYKYHLTDYMGNVRAVSAFDKTSSEFVVEQMTDYYPFGLAHNYNNLHKNRYLFSGKELQDAAIGHSGFLGLYDFGARYYNPMLGRWFNPDPALQTTNPYLFCGNAPMVYVDKDGRWFGIDDLFAAIIGGIINAVSGLISGDIHSAGHFFASFGAGAAAGWTTLYAGPVVSGAFLGATNSTLSQGFNNGWSNINWNSVMSSSALGGFTGGASAKVSGALAPTMNRLTGGIASPVVREAVNHGAVGAATGFTVGTSVALLQGKSFDDALKAGGTNAMFGLTIGTASGVRSGYQYAKQNNLNPWSGNKIEQPQNSTPSTKQFPYDETRLEARSKEDPGPAHNFPRMIDKWLLETTPEIKSDGYRIYRLPGYMNGKPGYFENGVTPNNVINHRLFRPVK